MAKQLTKALVMDRDSDDFIFCNPVPWTPFQMQILRQLIGKFFRVIFKTSFDFVERRLWSTFMSFLALF